ncbi:MAG: EcoRII [Gammaproteobacteria bacterium]|nr:EcoRII [Gammaproteobacteria bacterium]MBU1624503.1 EcoRII [Gammaproteobacteria bacterium]MBU1982347.1 EcoRII [Gammaproteobacteria bacterium]
MTVSNQWSDIQEWIGKSGQLFVKKLSRNDCGWAEGPEHGHQNGVYIPRPIRESNFFPQLKNVNTQKPHIFEAQLETLWPATGEIKTSNLKHYSNKGPEMHFTGVPKDEFSGLTPASLLIGGSLREPIDDVSHWFMVVDSAMEEVELIEAMFDLGADFHYGLFNPADALRIQQDETEQLIEELSFALKTGSLATFIASVSKMPAPEILAAEAQNVFLQQNDLDGLSPYEMEAPGDAIMKISRDIEYSLYKRAERRYRAAEVIRIITGGGEDIVSSVVRGFPDLDATFLSASQHRKSRAGRSFEQHIARLLRDGRIAFEEQAVTGGRRPDFVLPSLVVLNAQDRAFEDAMVLSAKTTLRERWKQVTMEKFKCELFLATVDDRVSSDAIDDMSSHGIHLVVPESLKKSKETCYKDKTNVITFREFFDDEISSKRPSYRVA